MHNLLTVNVESFPTGRQDHRVANTAQELLCKICGRVDHVLTIVEDDKSRFVGQKADQLPTLVAARQRWDLD